MKKFNHVKVADYNLGATYISKWIYAIYMAAANDIKLPTIRDKRSPKPANNYVG